MPGNFLDESFSQRFMQGHNIEQQKSKIKTEDSERKVKLEFCEEDVVISGMACRLPESDSVNEFRDNLMSNTDMMTADERRWTPGKYGIPERMGKIKDITKFDATFFGVHSKQANRMDPQLRMLLETTYEAIVDAGVNPEDLRGSNTGVFVGNCATDGQMGWTGNPTDTSGFTMIGCLSAMFSNRLSFFFDFKGPSYTIDTACSASFVALDQALLAIRSGQCDAAIVAGGNLCLLPTVSVQFTKLNMLSADGACKSFDESGNGYARAEAIVSIFLQKKKSSNRIYAQLVHSKINSDGAKDGDQSITYPSGKCQLRLMKELYAECGVNPHDVSYVEAHGTGTKAGDPEEVNAIADMFCKGRTTPLLLGSTKSCMGHPEAVSGIAAMTKVLIASEERMLPANLHYKSPNKNIPGLVDGRLKVVSENTKWDGGFVSISSFGFGGTNAHALLDTTAADAMAKSVKPSADTAKLITYCGRTEAALKRTFEEIHRSHSNNSSLHALLGKSAGQSCRHLPYRGFTLVNQPGNDATIDIQKCEGDNRPLWYIFSGMGSQWFGMAKELMQLEIFAKSIERSSRHLSEFGIDLSELLMSDDSSSFNSTINSFVSLAAIQVALVDILNALGLTPDGIIGHSVGELGSGYADGSLTAEETILAAYWRGKCITDAGLKSGAMAAVGLTWEEAKARCPEGVVPACHNSEDTVTISGNAEILRNFVQQLKQEDVFAKEVSTNGVAFHSPHMAAVAPVLREHLAQVIKPKRRSSKWISTSVTDESASGLTEYSSAEYHVNNLVSPVRFQEALASVPNNAVTVEIAPHALLQSILKRSLNADCVHIGLQKRGHGDNLELFYQGIGRLYQHGINVNVNALYNDASFPVPRGTPSISSLIGWDHSVSYDVPTESDLYDPSNNEMKFDINLTEGEKFLLGHKMDGRLIYPSAGYFIAAWRALAQSLGQDYKTMPVVFDNAEIHAPILMQKEEKTALSVSILPSTGAFEVTHDGKIKASGKIRTVESDEKALLKVPTQASNDVKGVKMSSKDIYYELRLRGYEYSGEFQGIVSSLSGGEEGLLQWGNNWLTFVDYMLQTGLLAFRDDSFRFPLRMRSLRIDPAQQKSSVLSHESHPTCIAVTRNDDLGIIQAGGVQLVGLELAVAPRIVKQKAAILETYEFTPYERVVDVESPDYLQCCSFAAKHALQSNADVSSPAVPLELVQHLAQLLGTHGNLPLDSYTDQDGCILFSQLKDLSGSTTSKSFLEDSLFTSLLSLRYIKPALDTVCESFTTHKLEMTELIDSQSPSFASSILASIDNILNIRPDYTSWLHTLASAKNPEDSRVNIKQSEHDVNSLPTSNQHLVLSSNTAQEPKKAEIALKMLRSNGFLLTADYTFHNGKVHDLLSADFELLYKVENPLQTLTLWRTNSSLSSEDDEMMEIKGFGTEWLEPLKERLEAMSAPDNEKRLWLVSNERNGTIGLANSLREETSGDRIRCMFNAGKGKLPDFNSEECLRQRSKNLPMNVYCNGTWGAYRHTPLTVKDKTSTPYADVSVYPPGSGLSNLRWIESSLKHVTAEIGSEMCKVSHVALNHRDMMLASGKLQEEALPGHQELNNCMLGLEFSGYSQKDQRRVMGLCKGRALATVVKADKDYLWDVPADWSMSEASSVPLAYSTAYYALIVRGNLQPKDTLLVHSAVDGSVGIAAVRIALSMGCQVIVTVKNTEHKKYMAENFPEIKPENVLDSQSTDFEFEIKLQTKGKGVDVVLNSLPEEKLQSSIQLLAKHGRFLQIGKADMENNAQIALGSFLKDISFHGVTLDSLFLKGSTEWQQVKQLISNGIETGAVKPLDFVLFNKDEVDYALGFLVNGRNKKKKVVRIDTDSNGKLDAMPRFHCNPNKSYLLTGGLGGFGLEVARWLVSRGATKLILTSRSGITNGYQAKLVSTMRDNGVEVKISSKNIVQYTEAEELIKECNNMAPLGGVFNSAMVLRDAMLENQTEQSFQTVLNPKVKGTFNLDSVTRDLCSNSLDHFVVFSSVWGGRGNAGQTNYSYANTVMERICEDRHTAGLPGLAIQWGSIGDVGVVMSTMGDNDFVLGGALPQRLTSCLSALDTFLCETSHPVLSSFVIADKSSGVKASDNIDVAGSVFKILGINDLSAVSKESTLSSLGLDSLTAAEVKQVLERQFNLHFSMKEIRALTISTLKAAEATLTS